jgi:hypothetical protein
MDLNFVITPTAGAITLPRFPSRIVHKLQADVKQTRFPGALPLLLAFGRKANVLQIEGIISTMPASSKDTLTTTYLTPLDAAVYKTVTITATGRLYSGRTYVFAGISFEERPGVMTAFFYTAEFWEGSQIISL